jgi:hypothetical protein
VKAKSRQDTLNYPAKLNAKLAGLLGAIGAADYAPTKGMGDVYDDLARRADAQIKKWQAIVDTEISSFDRMVRSSSLPAVGAGKSAKPARPKTPRATRARAARGRVRRRATAR